MVRLARLAAVAGLVHLARAGAVVSMAAILTAVMLLPEPESRR